MVLNSSTHQEDSSYRAFEIRMHDGFPYCVWISLNESRFKDRPDISNIQRFLLCQYGSSLTLATRQGFKYLMEIGDVPAKGMEKTGLLPFIESY